MATKNGARSQPVERKEGDERKKALSIALASIEKQFGKGAIMRMSDNLEPQNIEVCPTGSLSLDLALGVGGLPKGRIIEIFGPESSGKTTLSLQVIAEMQKTGGTCAFIDAEHALDIQYASRLGVQVPDLLLSQPDTGEQALEIVDALVMGDSLPGLQARLMSQALRKLTTSISRTKCIVIFINQIRMKIGGYGNPETTAGGNALKFYSSARLDIRRVGAIKKGDEVIGNETKVKVVKNKVAPPFKQVKFDILYGQGISRLGEIIDIGTELNVLEKSGAWYSYNGNRLGQGKEKVRDLLKDNVELQQEIEKKIRELKGAHVSSITSVDDEDMQALDMPTEEAEADDVPPAREVDDDL